MSPRNEKTTNIVSLVGSFFIFNEIRKDFNMTHFLEIILPIFRYQHVQEKVKQICPPTLLGAYRTESRLLHCCNSYNFAFLSSRHHSNPAMFLDVNGAKPCMLLCCSLHNFAFLSSPCQLYSASTYQWVLDWEPLVLTDLT